jgi:hypothetical protein
MEFLQVLGQFWPERDRVLQPASEKFRPQRTHLVPSYRDKLSNLISRILLFPTEISQLQLNKMKRSM